MHDLIYKYEDRAFFFQSGNTQGHKGNIEKVKFKFHVTHIMVNKLQVLVACLLGIHFVIVF